jgi:hypothetical protein
MGASYDRPPSCGWDMDLGMDCATASARNIRAFPKCFRLVLIILICLPLLVRAWRPFPFCVSVPTLAVSSENFQAHILILNLRSTNRVALTIEVCFKATEVPGHWYQQMDIQKLNPKLGPQEHTEAVVKTRIHNYPAASNGAWFLRVIDMVSRRKTPLFRIPGCYPPNSWIGSNETPVFTKIPDEILELTQDWSGRLNST